eukprot:TRINITY_DN12845_c0_g1_i1.p1 TRINITY_DN12845_c0_g1~~TRINITY_DN12845_c0_g1_i1.p1  ORF type:complete len:566 (-),score=99.60 TRINITY_DN12845_c0_g1_i1:30-1640(-)
MWEKMNLEPYAPKKNVNYYVVADYDTLSQYIQQINEINNQNLHDDKSVKDLVDTFFKELDALYESCHLGYHKIAKSPPINGYDRSPSTTDPEKSSEDPLTIAYKKYIRGCEAIGIHIKNNDLQTMFSTTSTVIYLLNDFQYFLQCNAKKVIFKSFENVQQHQNVVVVSVPLSFVLNLKSNFIGNLKQLAFDVYTKCRRISFPNQKSSEKNKRNKLYEPYTILSDRFLPVSLNPSLSPKPPSPNISLLNVSTMLHFAYILSPQLEFVVICCCDTVGELMESKVITTPNYDLSKIINVMWQFCMDTVPNLLPLEKTQDNVDNGWNLVIGKWGHFHNQEIDEWEKKLEEYRKERLPNQRISSVTLCSLSTAQNFELLSVHRHSVNGISGRSFVFFPNASCYFPDDYSKNRENMLAYIISPKPSTLSPPLITRDVTESNPNNWGNHINDSLISKDSEYKALMVKQYQSHHFNSNPSYTTKKQFLQEIATQYFKLSFLNCNPALLDWGGRTSASPIHFCVVKRLFKLVTYIQASTSSVNTI